MLGTAKDMKSHDLRGVRRLAGAVLVQAIEDIRRGTGKRREDAVRWILDCSDRELSFVFCCRALNRNPEAIRRSQVQGGLPDRAIRSGLLLSAVIPT